MKNIISYVKDYGHHDFEHRPFNEVDSLILSQLAYINYNFSHDEKNNFSLSLKDIFIDYYSNSLVSDTFNPQNNKLLIEAVASSVRFSNILIGHFVEDIDYDLEKQFSAITFKLSEELYYIAYRGTDASLIGWKENLNLSFTETLPGHHTALEYFLNVKEQTTGKYFVGGHSKGGHLATYACIACPVKDKKDIKKIFNHDGPGFLHGINHFEGYDVIKNKIHKTVPQTAIIGLLLHRNEPYKVIKSSGFTTNQHDPFNWHVKGGKFVHLDSVDAISLYIRSTVNKWCASIDLETRKLLVNSLFEMFKRLEEKDIKISKNKLRQIIKELLNEVKNSEKDVKKTIHKVTRKLIKVSLLESHILVTQDYTPKIISEMTLNETEDAINLIKH